VRGNVLRVFAMMALVLVGLACTTQRSNVSYQDRVKSALEQADLKGVSVDEDTEKNTITRLAETSLPSMPSPRPGMWRGQRLPAGSSPMRLVFSPLAQSPKPKTSPPTSTGRSRKTGLGQTAHHFRGEEWRSDVERKRFYHDPAPVGAGDRAGGSQPAAGA
jgi:hypothetical protein